MSIGIISATKAAKQCQLESSLRQKNNDDVNWNRHRDNCGKAMSIGITSATIAARQCQLELPLRQKNNRLSNWNLRPDKGKTAKQTVKIPPTIARWLTPRKITSEKEIPPRLRQTSFRWFYSLPNVIIRLSSFRRANKTLDIKGLENDE